MLKEYHHLCAVYGQVNPQLHHIDDDPSNHDPMNLIPLCPNNHLIDAHNPTQPIEPAKLKLLRKYKDPTVLTSQFHPLFTRMKFLDEIERYTLSELIIQGQELVDFIKVLEMGTFYSQQIKKLLGSVEPTSTEVSYQGSDDPRDIHTDYLDEEQQEFACRENVAKFRDGLSKSRDKVYELIVELLRYQPWCLEIQTGTQNTKAR